MSKPISIILRILGALLVLVVVAGGGFRIGYARGVVDSPAIAEQMQAWKNSDNLPAQNYHPGFAGFNMRGGYYAPYLYQGHFGYNPVVKLLGFIFFAFLFFGAMRMFFFRYMIHQQGWQGHMPPCAQQPNAQAPSQPGKPKSKKK